VISPTGDWTNVSMPLAWASINPSFPVVGETVATFTTGYTLSGGGVVTVRSSIYSANTLPAFTLSPQRPLIAPPSNLTVEGASAYAALSLTTSTPIIAWSASGGAVAYYVAVLRLFTDATNQPASESAAVLLTDQTQLTLPSGVLLSGNLYAVRVRAITELTGDPVNAPFRKGSYPFGFAETISAALTAP
jgi:hypothetical protein